MNFNFLFATKKRRIAFVAIMLALFLLVGTLSLFTYRLMKVKYSVSLWDIDENGEYYEVSSDLGVSADFGYIDGGYQATVYVDDFMELYTVKAYANEGYRFWKWSNGSTNPELRSWMHFGIDATAYFVPDRDSDAPSLNVRGEEVSLTTRTEKTWKSVAYASSPLGKGSLVETDYGYLLSLKERTEIAGLGEAHALLLLKSTNASDTLSLLAGLSLAEVSHASYELFEGTTYRGLYIAVASLSAQPSVSLNEGNERGKAIASRLSTGVMTVDGKTIPYLKGEKVSSSLTVEAFPALTLCPEAIRRNECFYLGTKPPCYEGTQGQELNQFLENDVVLFGRYNEALSDYLRTLRQTEQTLREQFQ
ncbi:MAG: hypothetical protein J6D37_05380 [Clostridia bacterium]|nr:hypothetical protein [Clostridia bacterium]